MPSRSIHFFLQLFYLIPIDHRRNEVNGKKDEKRNLFVRFLTLNLRVHTLLGIDITTHGKLNLFLSNRRTKGNINFHWLAKAVHFILKINFTFFSISGETQRYLRHDFSFLLFLPLHPSFE
eukprot:GILK01016843.1.p1 GENE.GILK01016843.1~~GILK01016843.1.p1  ORF type:complete len:121 (+),score=3.44 GILK01016843.1:297-659(+)